MPPIYLWIVLYFGLNTCFYTLLNESRQNILRLHCLFISSSWIATNHLPDQKFILYLDILSLHAFENEYFIWMSFIVSPWQRSQPRKINKCKLIYTEVIYFLQRNDNTVFYHGWLDLVSISSVSEGRNEKYLYIEHCSFEQSLQTLAFLDQLVPYT
jgi:hypothetical protein